MRTVILAVFLAAEAVFAFFLTGCGATFDYRGLRALDPEGGDFHAVLSREYKAFALFETDEMRDWPDAAHFGKKAFRAAQAVATPPERPRDWRLPKERIGPMTAAHARLTAVLGKGAAERAPTPAAVAQARFDCWLEQQEENWQWDHIALCRDGFHTALSETEKIVAAATADPLEHVVPAVLRDVQVRDPRTFTVFFGFDSTDLGPEAIEAVEAIAGYAKEGREVRVLIAGHADRAGPETYNRGLSQRRAEAVRAALAGRGLSPQRITARAFGEARPLVATPDGMREPRNRRAEVTVGPAPQL